VLDLGCGTGEHVAYFADAGARAVGLDRSEAMIQAAKQYQEEGRGRFVLGDVVAAQAALGEEPPFGFTICLGNVLPHITDDVALARLLSSARELLLPGGLLLIQLLNYEGILAGGKRHLPINIRPGDDGREIVFLRLMAPGEGGRVLFFPATLELDPHAEQPLRILTSRRVEVRAWTRADLAPALATAGFTSVCHGNMAGGDFIPAESDDLVIVANRI
jgi:SAM-dependent methyltransferase